MFKVTNPGSPVKRSDNFFDSFFDDIFDGPVFRKRDMSFKLDIKEDEKEYMIEADLPGIKKDEVKVSYEDQNLIIAIERNVEKEEDKETYLHKERGYTSMKRALRLPNVDPKKIKAKLEDGVLKLTIEKHEPAPKGHTIEIE